MELYFAATGVKHELDFFETQMQCMPMHLKFTDKEGKPWVQPIYGMLSPIKLYRYIFPKEYLGDVLKTLNFGYDKGFNPQKFALRKILNAKKIPKVEDGKARLFHQGNVGLMAIGIKEDDVRTFHTGETHEAI